MQIFFPDLFTMRKNLAWYSTFSKLHLPPMKHFYLILQFQINICVFLSSTCDLFAIFLCLFIILEILLVQE